MIRALNVPRQDDEPEVPDAWRRLTTRLGRDGIVVEGTCDEIGRRADRGVLDEQGPRSLVLACRLVGLDSPGSVAARLPEALRHRDVPGEAVHAWLAALDRAWHEVSPLASFGSRQRFTARCRRVTSAGWPVRHDPRGWREGVVEVAWVAVAPSGRPAGVSSTDGRLSVRPAGR